eukprot:scaffold18910_cov101-Isochrysis_galbana.AAC.3
MLLQDGDAGRGAERTRGVPLARCHILSLTLRARCARDEHDALPRHPAGPRSTSSCSAHSAPAAQTTSVQSRGTAAPCCAMASFYWTCCYPRPRSCASWQLAVLKPDSLAHPSAGAACANPSEQVWPSPVSLKARENVALLT